MDNPFELLLQKIEEIQVSKVKYIKLTKWCKKTGVSQTFALDCFRDVIYRPKGRIYMIDVDAANELIERDKIKKGIHN